jgi:methyltransferase (TIGR00027 family)
MGDQSTIRNISDTARWVAEYRARESERPDAVFRDPFARRLAGERGRQIMDSLPANATHSWAYVARTYLFDQFIAEQVAGGADLVLNLAAGLDARPYRMALPPTLQWVEVDLPELLDYKSDVLANETPACRLERIPLDLSDRHARSALFQDLQRRATRIMVVCEGLLAYLTPEAVGQLADDLAACSAVRSWAIDLTSPGLLAMIKKQVGNRLAEANAPLQFAPQEGPAFFEPHGWRAVDVRSILKAGARLKRVPLLLKLMSLLPERQPAGSRPWSGICLLTRAPAG